MSRWIHQVGHALSEAVSRLHASRPYGRRLPIGVAALAVLLETALVQVVGVADPSTDAMAVLRLDPGDRSSYVPPPVFGVVVAPGIGYYGRGHGFYGGHRYYGRHAYWRGHHNHWH